MPISDGNGVFVSAAPGKRFQFIAVVRLQRSVDPVGYLVYTTRSSTRSAHAISASWIRLRKSRVERRQGVVWPWPDDKGAQRSKWSTVMGGGTTRKTRCTALHTCDSDTEERSIKLRSILGVLPCLTLRIWRLRARTKNKYTMDNFSILIIREPWLLEKSFYIHRFPFG
jgi:hypothetical protein